MTKKSYKKRADRNKNPFTVEMLEEMIGQIEPSADVCGIYRELLNKEAFRRLNAQIECLPEDTQKEVRIFIENEIDVFVNDYIKSLELLQERIKTSVRLSMSAAGKLPGSYISPGEERENDDG